MEAEAAGLQQQLKAREEEAQDLGQALQAREEEVQQVSLVTCADSR